MKLSWSASFAALTQPRGGVAALVDQHWVLAVLPDLVSPPLGPRFSRPASYCPYITCHKFLIALRITGNRHLHSRYYPHTTTSTARSTAGIATTMSASMQAWIRTRACITP